MAMTFIRCEQTNVGLLQSLGALTGAYDQERGGVTAELSAETRKKLSDFAADFVVAEDGGKLPHAELVRKYEINLEKVKAAHPGWKGEEYVAYAERQLAAVKARGMEGLREVWQGSQDMKLKQGQEAYVFDAEDVANVLRLNAVRVLDSQGKPFSEMAEDLIDDLDLDAVIKASQEGGADLADRMDVAYVEIAQQLVDHGILKGEPRELPLDYEDEEVIGLEADGQIICWSAETKSSYASGDSIEDYGIHNLREREIGRVGVTREVWEAACTEHRKLKQEQQQSWPTIDVDDIDISDAILARNLQEIHNLEAGPCRAELDSEICQLYGVRIRSDITQKMIDAARAKRKLQQGNTLRCEVEKVDYAKEYDRMVEQSNRQQAEIDQLQAVLRDVSEGLNIVERKLKEAEAADPADAPFPLVGEQANLWHRAMASAYLHAVEICNSDTVRRFVDNGFKHAETMMLGADTEKSVESVAKSDSAPSLGVGM